MADRPRQISIDLPFFEFWPFLNARRRKSWQAKSPRFGTLAAGEMSIKIPWQLSIRLLTTPLGGAKVVNFL